MTKPKKDSPGFDKLDINFEEGGQPQPPPPPKKGQSSGGYYAAQGYAPAPKTPTSGYYPPAATPSGGYYAAQPQAYGQSYAVQTPPGAGVSQTGKTIAEGRGVSQSSATVAGGAATGAGDYSVQGLIGRTIDRYKIIKLLGEGGFGAVYKAEHTLMKRDVAFKTLHRELGKDPSVLHRFKKEGQVASRFQHRHAIELYDFGQMDDGTYFMAMEFLPGKDLRDHLKKKGALELGETFDIVIQALSALQAAHDGGVIHRDLKPDNIKLEERDGRTDFVKILDFGIAKIKDLESRLDRQTGKMSEDEARTVVRDLGPVAEPPDVAEAYKTQVGAFFGTPEYGSPEQCAGEEIDARSDLYTMGVILYECLTGSLPFVSKTPQGYLAQHMVAPPRPISEIRPDLKIPPQVEAVMMKALEKKREDRFQSANEFADALIKCAQECGIPITVEGGGTVVVKTPMWKLALAIGVPVIAIAATAVTWVKMRADPPWETAQAQYQELLGKHQYEDAQNYLATAGKSDPELLDRRSDWFAKSGEELTRLIDARDKRVEAFLGDAKNRYEGAKLEDRVYDPYIDEIKGKLERDEEVRAAPQSLRDRFTKRMNEITADRNRDAQAFWAKYEKEIDAVKEQCLWDKAKQMCVDFPEKFARTNQAQLAKDKRAKVADEEARAGPLIKGALEALERAHKYRADHPDDYLGQIEQYEGVARDYGNTPPGFQAKSKWLSEVRGEFEKAGENALKPLQEAADVAMAVGSAQQLSGALERLATFPAQFRKTEKASAAWNRLTERVRQTAFDRWRDALKEAWNLREAFKPEKGAELIVPWTAHLTDASIKMEATDLLESSFKKAIALHAGMVMIPAAQVEIGERSADLPSGPIQSPVAVAAFSIDPYETTNAQYLTFLQDRFRDDPAARRRATPEWWGSDTFPVGLENHPVRGIGQADAMAFAKWAGKRLPTEVEWEYAARGANPFVKGTKVVHDYPWGVMDDPGAWMAYGRFKSTGEKPPTKPVGSYEAGKSDPFGLYDMAGNVSEWTSSPYMRYENPRSRAEDDYGPHRMVTRGGSYQSHTLRAVRCTNRLHVRAEARPEDVGFRCVKPAGD